MRDGGRVQNRCGDLAHGRDCSVAHFRGAVGEMIRAIGAQVEVRLGTLLGRRDAIVHVDGVAFPFEPLVAFGLRLAASAGQRLLDKIHALIEAITADLRVGRAFPNAVHGVAGNDDIFALQFHEIHAELARQIAHRGFHGEDGLRGAVTAESSGGHDVRVNRVAVALHIRAAIDLQRLAERCGQRFAAMIAVGAGVGNHANLQSR